MNRQHGFVMTGALGMVLAAGALARLSGPEQVGATAAGVAASVTAHAEPARHTIDAVHSHVNFRIRHMGASSSWGRFNDVSGHVALDAAAPDAGSVEILVKTDSVDTANAKRDQHLKSQDFFSAKEFPEISFKSKSIKASGAGAFDVTGELTLHGVTKPLTVTLTKVGEGKGMDGSALVGYDTTFTLKRSDFGMSTYVKEGALSDEVTLMVSLEAAKK